MLCTLALRDFRNLARLDLVFPTAGVVVIGDNGQGKSNLLEAIYYLHLLRSVRGARDVDVARFGAPGFHVAARTEGGTHREISAGETDRTAGFSLTRRQRFEQHSSNPLHCRD